MPDTAKETALTLVEEEFDELDSMTPASLREVMGVLVIQMTSLGNELALADEDQDADKLLQIFVRLAAVATHAAARQVLPAIEKEAA